jgi:hypothetical protein
MSKDTPCPECKAGKHGNCDGISWDLEQDVQAICTCSARKHEPYVEQPTAPDPDKVYEVTVAQLYAAACTRKETCGAHKDTVDKIIARLEKQP